MFLNFYTYCYNQTVTFNLRDMFDVSEKTLVVQHNSLVEARYRLSVESQRLIKTLVSLINSNDEDFKTYELKVVDLAKIIGAVDDGYYKTLKRTTRSIIGNTIDFIDENGNEVQAAWLSSAVYRKGRGVVELRFDPVLKPYLLQLKSFFTTYELGNILRLKGVYAIRIYELLKQYERIGQREFGVSELRDILKVETKNDYYREYKNFKRYILKPAVAEVSEKTDLECSFSEIKKGRFIDSLVFHMKGKTRRQIDYLETPEVQQQQQEEPKNDYVEQLVDMGVTRTVAVQLVTDYDEERILRGIAITEENQKMGRLQNKAAFLVVSIEQNYKDDKLDEKLKKAEALQLQVEREQLKKQWEDIKSRYGKWKAGAVDAALLGMTTAEIEEEKRQFIASINGVMWNSIKKSKESEKRHFHLYMGNQLPLDTLEAWAQKNGVDLSVFPDDIRQ